MATNLVTTTPSRFSVIRPDLLPTMRVLQQVDIERNIQDRLAQLVTIWNKYDPPNAAQYDVGGLEFDPIKINIELNALFEGMVRDRVNQAARAITLAFAVGSDLDAIASRYPYGVPRKTKAAGTWNGPGDAEPDSVYKTRVWLSPNILSLSGPGQAVYESYKFWALSAPMPTTEGPIKDASAFTKPHTGNVYLVVLPANPINTTWEVDPVYPNIWKLTTGSNVVPTRPQLSAIYQYITAPYMGRMGLTDVLYMQKPKVINTTIDIDIWSFPSVDRVTLMNSTAAAVGQLIVDINWLGADLTTLSLDAALSQAGAYNRVVNSPTQDIIVGPSGTVNVTGARLRFMGVGE